MTVALLSETADPDAFLGDPAYCVQEKLDGERLIIHKSGSTVIGYNRRGEPRTMPDTVRVLAASVPCDFTVDGELMPDGYVAFDLLSWDGDDMRQCEMKERFYGLFVMGLPFRLVRCFGRRATKRALLECIYNANGEGVVFKLLTAPYTDGRGQSEMVKYKFRQSDSFEITALHVNSVSISQRGVDCGKVGLGSVLVACVGDVVEVRYTKRFTSGKLCQPCLLAIRRDVGLEEVR